MKERIISRGDVFRHFKGNLYRVICEASHTETGEPVVVYERIGEADKVYVRPKDMFLSPVDRDKYPDVEQEYRFALHDSAVKTEHVNHPTHYNAPGRKECIDEMVDIWGAEQTAVWCEMTAYKYEYRAGSKEGNSAEQDLAKRQWYLNKAAELRSVACDAAAPSVNLAEAVAVPSQESFAAPAAAGAAPLLVDLGPDMMDAVCRSVGAMRRSICG